MKKSWKIILLSVLCSFIISACCSYFLIDKIISKKVVWVNVTKLYNDFEMKKEYEKKYEKTELARKKITDSLELELRMLYKQLQEEKQKESAILFEAKRESYLKQKNEFDQDNEQTKTTYNNQILNQINQYMKEYGKDRGYDIIFGAEGSGSVMYAKESIEITDEAVSYINKKYKGL